MTLAGTDKIIFKHQLPQNATASFHIKQKKQVYLTGNQQKREHQD